jgi:hypothetical protein
MKSMEVEVKVKVEIDVEVDLGMSRQLTTRLYTLPLTTVHRTVYLS